MVPRDKASMCAEVSIPSHGAPDLQSITESVLAGLRAAALLRKGEKPCLIETIVIDPAYVIHDHKRDAALKAVLGYLREHQVFPGGGCYGEWSFFNMDQDVFCQVDEQPSRQRESST